MAKPLARTVVLAAALGGVATPVFAQDPAADFRQAVLSLRANETDKSLELLRALAVEDLTPETANAIWRAAGGTDFAVLIGEGGEFAELAKTLLAKVRPEAADRSKDEAGINAAVQMATAKGGEDRAKGLKTIRENYGDYAVPALLRMAADPNEDLRADYAIVTLIRLGNEATPALIAALDASAPASIRIQAALALGRIGDRRAAPTFAAIAANDASDTLRTLAKRALNEWGVTTADPVEMHLGAARAMSQLDAESKIPPSTVWTWEDGGLVSREVPASLYYLEIAKQHAASALSLNPESAIAYTMLQQTYEAQLAQASDLDGSAVAGLARASQAIQVGEFISIEVPDAEVGTQIAATPAADQPELLPGFFNARDFALRTEAGVRAAFVLDAANIPNQAKLVDVLAEGSIQESNHTILFLDSGRAAQSVAKTVDADRGVSVVIAGDEIAAANALANYRQFDLVLINSDFENSAVVGRLCKNAGCAKVLVHSMGELEDTEAFDDFADDYIALEESLNAETLRGAVSDNVEEFDGIRAEPNKVAQDSAAALVRAGEKGIDTTAAGDRLIAQLDREISVARPAALALGYAGEARHIDRLLAIANSGDDTALSLRQATTEAIGRILMRAGADTDPKLVDSLIALATAKDGDEDLRLTASTALGMAPLSKADRARVAIALSAVAGS